MSSGKVHNAASASATIASAALFLYTANDISGMNQASVVLGIFSGGLTSLFIGPDLDVDSGNISRKLMRDIGYIPLLFWTIFWEPYGYAIKHRSSVSHMPVVGTWLRLLFLLLPITINFFVEEEKYKRAVAISSGFSQILALVWIMVAVVAIFILQWAEINLVLFAAMFVGQLMINDLLHFIFDGELFHG